MDTITLDHINIRTRNLATLVAFYRDVLGLKEGRRPDFDFPGAWLYAGDAPVVHLTGVDYETDAPSRALQLSHYAFTGTDKQAFIAILEKHGIDYFHRDVPGFDVVQINFRDPDGNHIHVDFAKD